MTPEEPEDIAEHETDEHVDVDSNSATQKGLVTEEHYDGQCEGKQGENVADITEY